jgi:hypothetical protein
MVYKCSQCALAKCGAVEVKHRIRCWTRVANFGQLTRATARESGTARTVQAGARIRDSCITDPTDLSKGQGAMGHALLYPELNRPQTGCDGRP